MAEGHFAVARYLLGLTLALSRHYSVKNSAVHCSRRRGRTNGQGKTIPVISLLV